jgi:hypothetical protein
VVSLADALTRAGSHEMIRRRAAATPKTASSAAIAVAAPEPPRPGVGRSRRDIGGAQQEAHMPDEGDADRSQDLERIAAELAGLREA